MALRTKDDLQTMDYAFHGEPFVSIPAKDSIDLETMDYAFRGQPFVSGIATGEEPEPPEETETNVLFMFANF
jgi:hypothetical protein